ncbi:phosphotriesterase family protein [Halovenus marina]|uniref:phosphotriesterase family protein n=1 Tax=Halovenus marina TaxID=3396621 RepID=UPI003F5499A2
MSDDTGQVVTVTGQIEPDDVGVTLPHEHLFIDLVETWFEPPESVCDRKTARESLSLENYRYVRQNQLSIKDNARLESYDEACAEIERFASLGGGTVVDVTPKNVGGDPRRVRRVSRQTGVNVVHGTAFYTKPAHPARVSESSVDELADEFVSDVREGIGDTDVRAGIIGELGVSEGIQPDEQKVLRAGARAALRTGAPVTIHPTGRGSVWNKDQTYPSSRWGLDILDILENEGLDPSRVIMGHMDRDRYELKPESLTYQRELADRGAFVEYDLWGNEKYYTAHYDKKPSDPARIEAASELVDDGYADSLLFSHDVAFKDQLTKYGGFGYGHILENIVPMLREAGISRETIDTILEDNPGDALEFVESE